MKLSIVFFILVLCSLLFFACSSKDTAKAAPEPSQPNGTTLAEKPKGSPATGTTLTPEGVEPTEPGGVLTLGGNEEKTAEDSSATTPGSITTSIADEELFAAIKDKLKKNDISPVEYTLNMDIQNGVVTLKGKVPSQEEADRIIALIKTVPKVKEVVSELTIENP